MDDLTTLGNNSQPFIVSKEHTALLAKTLTDLESKDGHQPMKQMGPRNKLVQHHNTRQRKFQTKASEEKQKTKKKVKKKSPRRYKNCKYATDIGATNKH